MFIQTVRTHWLELESTMKGSGKQFWGSVCRNEMLTKNSSHCFYSESEPFTAKCVGYTRHLLWRVVHSLDNDKNEQEIWMKYKQLC